MSNKFKLSFSILIFFSLFSFSSNAQWDPYFPYHPYNPVDCNYLGSTTYGYWCAYYDISSEGNDWSRYVEFLNEANDKIESKINKRNSLNFRIIREQNPTERRRLAKELKKVKERIRLTHKDRKSYQHLILATQSDIRTILIYFPSVSHALPADYEELSF